ncbi:MAG: hypothetical protein ACPG5T_10800, partial [Endozoicomonas sp.]
VFLGNLISGFKAGFLGFFSRIGQHLKKGLLGWLFGALQEAGLQIPQQFDLKGIFSLIFQVLGLTWQAIRERAKKILGPKLVERLEKVADIFILLKAKGLPGVWDMLKDRVVQFKNTVMEQIQGWVVTRIIKSGVQWIVGLFNPVAGLIKIGQMIYNLVTFIVERGQQMAGVAKAFVGSLGAIASGKVQAMAGALEGALASTLPVVIGLMANFIGVGGIGGQISKAMKKIQKPVGKAVDWVIGKAVEIARRAGRLFGKKQTGTEAEYDDPEKQAKIEAMKSDTKPTITWSELKKDLHV